MSGISTTEHTVSSWLGIPYATAERFRRPTLLPFDPDLPYDQNGPAPLQAGDTSWLEADNGFSEDCLNLNVWAPTMLATSPSLWSSTSSAAGGSLARTPRPPRTRPTSPRPVAPSGCL